MLLALLCAAAIAGCKKDPATNGSTVETTGNIAYVLNEGGWGLNEAELSVIDLDNQRITNNYFAQQNRRGLGSVAQDVIVYGSKVYVAVWETNTIEVLDRSTGISTQIGMGDRGPRYLAACEGKVYASCYQPYSVVRIDTASLRIEATCQLSGTRPEGICAADGKLYVVNSWKPDAAGNAIYDSTLSVVDIATFSETQKITIGPNPQKVKTVDGGYLAVSYTGDYGEHTGGIAVLDMEDMSLRHHEANVSNMDTYNGKIYYYGNSHGSAWNGVIHVLDAATMQESNITLDKTSQFSQTYYPYAINVSRRDGSIYIAGAQYGANGDIYRLTPTGSIAWQLEAGPLPSKIVEP